MPARTLHPTLVSYSQSAHIEAAEKQANAKQQVKNDAPIRVIELFAGVGGFRIGLERASSRFSTLWSNQWEPSTKRQDASSIYCQQFGAENHSNQDVTTIPTACIPECDLLTAGFPCQDYSVATTLRRSGGIEGKKGVLWWQIYRVIAESAKPPQCLFLENVDRLLTSPASQRGRDFGIILASLADLGYAVEWRVINAAEYGMPQRRRRVYIVAFRNGSSEATAMRNGTPWLFEEGVFAKSFPATVKPGDPVQRFSIKGTLDVVSCQFSARFKNAGVMVGRQVETVATTPLYSGAAITLGQLIENEERVPDEFFIEEAALPKWKYCKGSKRETRRTADGHTYSYSEGAMAFPDSLDMPSRTIITGEGGAGPSRFKHVIHTKSGRYRRLMPVELERLNMFPDGHTEGATASRRAFLMGNALITGVVEKVGLELLGRIAT